MILVARKFTQIILVSLSATIIVARKLAQVGATSLVARKFTQIILVSLSATIVVARKLAQIIWALLLATICVAQKLACLRCFC